MKPSSQPVRSDDAGHQDRAEREREQYNQGLRRRTYNNVLSHADYFTWQQRVDIVRKELEFARGKRVLELGNMAWYGYLEEKGIYPAETHAINISEAELQKGRDLVTDHTVIRPVFHLMDAHKLEFPDHSFDVIFGAAILHHLDHIKILDEMKRVLKPDGMIFFLEPLDNNPVAKLVRMLTPQARTIDEQPWRFQEMRSFLARYDARIYYQGFLTVPCGVISRFLCRHPDNRLNRLAFWADNWIADCLPFARPFFRQIIFAATPRRQADL